MPIVTLKNSANIALKKALPQNKIEPLVNCNLHHYVL